VGSSPQSGHAGRDLPSQAQGLQSPQKAVKANDECDVGLLKRKKTHLGCRYERGEYEHGRNSRGTGEQVRMAALRPLAEGVGVAARLGAGPVYSLVRAGAAFWVRRSRLTTAAGWGVLA
jgi:hypothetical protein